ncbi:hypothetical protein V3G39_07585 [Dermatophilaceae bacterium Sec6.4]
MSVLAALLLAVGIADLVGHGTRSRAVRYAVGPVVLIGVAAIGDLRRPTDVALLLLAAATGAAWQFLRHGAGGCTAGRYAGPGGSRALWALGGGAAIVAVTAGSSSHADGILGHWLRHNTFTALHGLPADRFLLIVAIAVIQLATGNELVRLVLTSIGAVKPEGVPQPSDELRGGRLLGPMERLFILGLGLAGQPTAAALVIAAKGLIRFPELQARRSARLEVSGLGIDAVTEYFLVGSFVSWLIALGGLGLAALG